MNQWPKHIQDQIDAICAQAEALREGTVPVPHAAAKRLAENAETLRCWLKELERANER